MSSFWRNARRPTVLKVMCNQIRASDCGMGIVGPLGRWVNVMKMEGWIMSRRRTDYQGVALRWENAWAFGPHVFRPACLWENAWEVNEMKLEAWIMSRRRTDYQGVALRWENAWAFGPHVFRPPNAVGAFGPHVVRGSTCIRSASRRWFAPRCVPRRGVGSPSEGHRPGRESRPPLFFLFRPIGPTVRLRCGMGIVGPLGRRVNENGGMDYRPRSPGRCPSLGERLGLRPACCPACVPLGECLGGE